jgi:peptidoglycan/LPS O-acetylase OafA/YrhL
MGEPNHKGRIEELEGLRGMAALAVLVYHVGDRLQPLGVPVAWSSFFVVPLGGTAVMVFFVLSGFVIGYIHREPWNRTNVAEYLFRRLIRLYPIYLVALLLSFAVARRSLFSWDFLVHLTFLQGALAPVISSNGPLWSLPYEVVYYLLYLALWRFPRSLKWFAGLSLAAVLASIWLPFFLLKVLALYGFWLFGCWLAKAGSTKTLVVSGNGRFWVALFLVCANINGGGWGGVLKRLGGGSGWEWTLTANGPLIADIFLSATRRQLIPCLAWTACGASCSVTCLDLGYGFWTGKFYHLYSYQVAALLLLLAAVAAVRRWPSPPSWFWSKVSWLGGVSYALYVIHNPILASLLPPAVGKMRRLGGCLLGAALSLLLAWLLERPYQRWVAGFLKRRLLAGASKSA